jgi:hypothetical protein
MQNIRTIIFFDTCGGSDQPLPDQLKRVNAIMQDLKKAGLNPMRAFPPALLVEQAHLQTPFSQEQAEHALNSKKKGFPHAVDIKHEDCLLLPASPAQDALAEAVWDFACYYYERNKEQISNNKSLKYIEKMIEKNFIPDYNPTHDHKRHDLQAKRFAHFYRDVILGFSIVDKSVKNAALLEQEIDTAEKKLDLLYTYQERYGASYARLKVLGKQLSKAAKKKGGLEKFLACALQSGDSALPIPDNPNKTVASLLSTMKNTLPKGKSKQKNYLKTVLGDLRRGFLAPYEMKIGEINAQENLIAKHSNTLEKERKRAKYIVEKDPTLHFDELDKQAFERFRAVKADLGEIGVALSAWQMQMDNPDTFHVFMFVTKDSGAAEVFNASNGLAMNRTNTIQRRTATAAASAGITLQPDNAFYIAGRLTEVERVARYLVQAAHEGHLFAPFAPYPRADKPISSENALPLTPPAAPTPDTLRAASALHQLG